MSPTGRWGWSRPRGDASRRRVAGDDVLGEFPERSLLRVRVPADCVTAPAQDARPDPVTAPAPSRPNLRGSAGATLRLGPAPAPSSWCRRSIRARPVPFGPARSPFDTGALRLSPQLPLGGTPCSGRTKRLGQGSAPWPAGGGHQGKAGL